MNLNDYQKQAARTLQCKMTKDELISNLVFGLCGETGEIADYLKKALYHRHDFDIYELENELGDALWYLSMIAEYFGLNMVDVAEANIDKLQSRYPDGFSYDDSKNRRDRLTSRGRNIYVPGARGEWREGS